MAVVTTFFQNPVERSGRHQTEVDCGWSVVETASGRLLQLDTFGSKGRQIVGKKSQTVQFDRSAAIELIAILKRTFPDE